MVAYLTPCHNPDSAWRGIKWQLIAGIENSAHSLGQDLSCHTASQVHGKTHRPKRRQQARMVSPAHEPLQIVSTSCSSLGQDCAEAEQDSVRHIVRQNLGSMHLQILSLQVPEVKCRHE